MPASASKTCDYRLEIGIDLDKLSSERCRRPVWEDHDRCVWHAEVDGKTIDDFEHERPDPGENLDGAYLKDASLIGVDWFANTSMIYVNLTDAAVNSVDFSGANLMLSTLTGISGLNADFRDTNLEGAIFTNADLRRANLENALLNQAVLTDVHIGSGTTFGETSVYEQETAQTNLSDIHRLEAASWTYRQLQQLYGRNAMAQLARRSYVQNKNAWRRFAWEERDYTEAIKWELSRWIVGYGISPFRVLGFSGLLVVLFAILFPLTGGIQEVRADQAITYTINDPQSASPTWLATVIFKSLYFSVVTFATLGYGDIQPIGMSARLLAGFEAILGALLSALMVFVLARRVTW